jgi:hypothetical protein
MLRQLGCGAGTSCNPPATCDNHGGLGPSDAPCFYDRSANPDHNQGSGSRRHTESGGTYQCNSNACGSGAACKPQCAHNPLLEFADQFSSAERSSSGSRSAGDHCGFAKRVSNRWAGRPAVEFRGHPFKQSSCEQCRRKSDIQLRERRSRYTGRDVADCEHSKWSPVPSRSTPAANTDAAADVIASATSGCGPRQQQRPVAQDFAL